MESLSLKDRAELARIEQVGERALKACQGVFSGMLSKTLLADQKVEIKVGGPTFSVGAFFKYYHAISSFLRHINDYDLYVRNFDLQSAQIKGISLGLPDATAFGVAGLDIKSAREAGLHEIGHIVFDLLEDDNLPLTHDKWESLSDMIYKIRHRAHLLPLWVNLLSDIRLERRFVEQGVVGDFSAIQGVIWKIEEETRRCGEIMVQSLIRDLGKKHPSPQRAAVLNEYSQKTWDIVARTEHIWSTIDEKSTMWEIIQSAVDMISALNNEMPPPPPDDDDREGDQGGDDQGNDDQDGDQGNDDQDDDQGNDDQDDDQGGDQGNDGQGGDQGDDDQGDDDQGGDDQDDDQGGDQDDDQGGDQGNDDQGGDDQGGDDPQTRDSGREIDPNSLRRAQSNKALDPSSMMKSLVNEREHWIKPATKIEYAPF